MKCVHVPGIEEFSPFRTQDFDSRRLARLPVPSYRDVLPFSRSLGETLRRSSVILDLLSRAFTWRRNVKPTVQEGPIIPHYMVIRENTFWMTLGSLWLTLCSKIAMLRIHTFDDFVYHLRKLWCIQLSILENKWLVLYNIGMYYSTMISSTKVLTRFSNK